MSTESANWCRFAQLIINQGAKVLRTLLQLEIVTSILRRFSDCWWDSKLTALYSKILWGRLHTKLKTSTECNDPTLNDLLNSWKTPIGKSTTFMEEIYTLKRWNIDIGEKLNPDLGEVNKTLQSWSTEIEQEIEKLNPMCTFIKRFEDKFLKRLYCAQLDLQLQGAKNDKFLASVRSRLKENEGDFKHFLNIYMLKKELLKMKRELYSAISMFKDKCYKQIIAGLQKCGSDSPTGECLETFKDGIKDVDISVLVNEFYGTWYTNLERVFDNRHNFSHLISSLDEMSSFKNMKIGDFFRDLNQRIKKKRKSEKVHNKLLRVATASDLDDLDLNLLTFVLKESNIVNYQSPDWDEYVPDWDKTTSADIVRLSSRRNAIVAHIAEAKLSTHIFRTLWEEITVALCNIASRCGDTFKGTVSQEIDKALTDPLEPPRMLEIRIESTEWCKTYIKVAFPGADRYQELSEFIQRAERNIREVRPCPRCNMKCSTEGELQQHMRNYHVHPCPRCNTQYSTKEDLQQHMRNHQEPNAAGVAAAAGSGAAVGLVLGPPGAVVGAVVGGLIGFLSGRK